jgi:chromosome segregation ATPase
MRIVTEQRQRLLRNLELLEPEEVEEMKPRLDELKVQRETLMQQAGQLRERLQGRTADRDRLERLLQWARLEIERVDELSV